MCIASIFNKRQVVAGSQQPQKPAAFKTLDYGKLDRGQGAKAGVYHRFVTNFVRMARGIGSNY